MTELDVLAVAARWPDRPFIVADGEVLTTAEVAREVAERVAWLKERGVGANAALAFVAESTLSSILHLLALFHLGVTAIPLHPRWTEADQRRYLRGIAGELAILRLEAPTRPPTRHTLCARSPVIPGRGMDPESIAVIAATSGSSGTPRGVKLSRRAFMSSAEASAKNLGWQEHDRWALTLPLAHIGGLSILTRCLCGERALVLGPRGALTSAWLGQQAVTLLSLVPTQLLRLLESNRGCPGMLRAVLVGGAAASPSLVKRARQQGWPVLTTYGSTETCSQVATQSPGTSAVAGCGKALTDVELRELSGRLQVRSSTLLSGYVGETTPALDAAGWFQTNDLCTIAEDGTLHVLGRADDVIITGGENVLPAEVEAALLEHASIVEVCVFGVADVRWGQAIGAALVTRDAEQALDLTEALSDLARFKHPKRWWRVDRLPRTRAGKLDRAVCARLAEREGVAFELPKRSR